jgi:precorrin-6B methylase 2
MTSRRQEQNEPMTQTPSADAPLRLAPQVTVSIRDNVLTARADGTHVELPARLLPLLDAFRSPLTLRDAMARCAATTKLEWMETSSAIINLKEAGVLVGEWAPLPARSGGFGSAKIHVAMLEDEVRTLAFIKAIRETVQPGDVVVDLGTGTGVLALTAAKAGARHVYAIEETEIANVANALFEANGVADRITLVRGHSTDVSLPERADVFVSEIIGNDPFGEQVLAYTRDAINRFLKPGARLVPESFRMLARGVSLDPELRHKHLFSRGAAQRWSEQYGIDYSPIAELRPQQPFMVRLPEGSFEALTPPVPVVEVDLRSPSELVQCDAVLPVSTGGALHGVVTWFDIPAMQIGSDPWDEGRARSWDNLVWMLPQERQVSSGDRVPMVYRYSGVSLALEIG